MAEFWTAPTVTAVTVSGTGITNGTGAVGLGTVVTLTVTFSDAVTVAGAPSLALNDACRQKKFCGPCRPGACG